MPKLQYKFSTLASNLDPELIVAALDQHIIGQVEAKRAVAIAFRNRNRRRQLPIDIQKEIKPANILMKGPTGCGKTEISRRVADLAEAPFVKVEATQYTEVGIVGANINSMIKDLIEVAINQEREKVEEKVKGQGRVEAEKKVLSDLELELNEENLTKLRSGELDQYMVDMSASITKKRNSRSSGDDDSLMNFLSNLNLSSNSRFSVFSGGEFSGQAKKNKKTMSVAEALPLLSQQFSDALVDENEVIARARVKTEQEGIIFIDEIDKLAAGSDSSLVRGHSLREGVQKELLSLLEGCTVSTRYGPVQTNHILFIASGAFHLSSVSDLMPELQGRLPVRVELKSLDMKDLRRVLCEKKYNLIEEVKALLGTENLTVQFTEDGIDEIARFAYLLNTSKGNVGARRLTSVMHTVTESISFLAHRLAGTTQVVDREYVRVRMQSADPTAEENLSKYIL